jgi:hypothetical protein
VVIEQAFFHLPEILHGSGYSLQEYEAGIVGALSLSVLQVLNGRNATNPISYLHHEKLYRDKGVYTGAYGPRYLRADLRVKANGLKTGNSRLAQYGWRHYNWLEAKFLRGQSASGTKHSGNKPAHAASFIADLLRLSILVPEKGSHSSNGRYFLHVYDSDPTWYLTYRKRPWMRLLCQPGRQTITLKNLDQEPKTVTKLLGNFPDLELELNIANYTIDPLDSSMTSCFWMYLTRIDKIKARLNGYEFEVLGNREIHLRPPTALDELSKFVAESINIKPASSDTLPATDDEIGATDDGDEDDDITQPSAEQAP